MIQRVAVDYLRSNPHKSWTSVAAMALAVAMTLAGMGTWQGIGRNPSLVRIMFGDWLAGLFLFIAVVGLLLVAIGRYFEVAERTSEFGILRVLGCSARTLAALLSWETAILAIPAMLLGIGLCLLFKLVVALFFAKYLRVEVVYAWWPISGSAAAAASLLGGLIGAPRAVRDGVIEALSYKK